MENKRLIISGAGTNSGGEYDEVSLSGASKVTGDIKCITFHASGACKCLGKVEAEDSVKMAGASKIVGEVSCKTFKVSGSSSCDGTISADDVKTSGDFSSSKKIKCKSISVSGTLKVRESIYADSAQIAGSVKVYELSADNVNVRGKIRAENVLGDEVSIYGEGKLGILSLFGRKIEQSVVGLIECTTLKADYLDAKTVRTRDAYIGKNCKIETLEYSGTVDIHNSAKVVNLVKIE